MSSWNKLPYHRRLFAALTLYSVMLAGCLAVFQYHREKKFKAEELNMHLQNINGRILSSITQTGDGFNADIVNDTPFPEIRVSILDSIGNIIYDNTLDDLHGTPHTGRKEIREAMAHGTGYTLRRHSQSTGGTYFYSARKGRDHIVRTAVPYSVTLTDILKADYGFLWFMVAVTLVMIAIGYVFTRRIGEHISRLNRFARKAETGEPIFDTEPFPHDELGDISNHIVRLYVKLRQALSERDREHRRVMHEQQEKARIKKQLTQNINHELKTPVAAIQVCIETLMAHNDMPEHKRLDFLQRSLSNIHRLNHLLDDVSLITRMDDGAAVITHEHLALHDVITETVHLFDLRARDSGIDIHISCDKNIILTGNRQLIASIFSNLIENAITYSGGNRIDIEIYRTDSDRLLITVADNGCGVESEHLPRLFERFYRVDKGRSRSAGGTGLGLSIVKNAVKLHHGDISVLNRPEGGLMFRISLPAS